MKNWIYWGLLFSLIFYLGACHRQDGAVNADHTKATLSAFRDTIQKQMQDNNLPNRLAYWNKQLQNPSYQADSVVWAKIHYNLAGVFYAMGELDSIKQHMQIAWLLLEKQTAYDDEKVLLYNGLGNIAYLEQKLHQENYYYNRAAQMLNADTSLKLTPKQKITIYFAAAQSSAHLRQIDNAFSLNRKALALLPALDFNPKDSFRAYSQMASYYVNFTQNLDSLAYYIHKMEEVAVKAPDDDKKRFVYDRKVGYFLKLQSLDSALSYSRKRLALDLDNVNRNGAKATSVVSGNLYLCYVDLAGIFTNLKQLDSASYYLKAAKNFTAQYPGRVDDESLILYEQNRIAYFFAIKNYAAAENEQLTLSKRTKILYETENARAVAEMAALFQLQAKDKSITHLNKTVLLSQTELQRNRLWLAISTLVLLLAIAVALLLYFIQRQRKLQSATERIQLEQRLLRTQMEPHFIFNTLSALQSFIRFNDNEKALKYLHQFGRLLRSSLQLSRESTVKLSEEIEALENYLSLQQMRYDDAFCYQIEIDEHEDTERIFIPPMLMQPFVENAILHGINPNGHDGMITINLSVQGDLLLVTISDNGSGIAEKPQSGPHKSLATAISSERLAIIAKETGLAAGIDIRSSSTSGTTVTITIPIKSTQT